MGASQACLSISGLGASVPGFQVPGAIPEIRRLLKWKTMTHCGSLESLGHQDCMIWGSKVSPVRILGIVGAVSEALSL